MALVAYSDGSDLSDDEEFQEDMETPGVSGIVPKINMIPIISHGIESIEDEDDAMNINSGNYEDNYDDESSSIRSLLASLPAAMKSNHTNSAIETETDDVVDDVPTLKTWHINGHTKVDVAIENKAGPLNNRRTKRKFILPALSEFIGDDEEERSDAQKKIKKSDSGCGLMALLPPVKKPQTTIFTMMPDAIKNRRRSQPQPQPKKPVVAENSDSDDDMGGSGFFTFKDDPVIPAAPVSIAQITPVLGTIEIGPARPTPREEEESRMNAAALSMETHSPASRTPAAINQAELIKLAGRRNAGEIVNIIDVNADDALMSRHEWMTRSMAEEKPKMSYSKKKSDGPSQQSRRKHQITYLAHQAKEREQELQNNWASARQTKSQTQAKYGF